MPAYEAGMRFWNSCFFGSMIFVMGRQAELSHYFEYNVLLLVLFATASLASKIL